MRLRSALAALLATGALLAGCSPKLIPGSEIRDTDENRQIIDVVTAYKRALEARDVDGIMKLVSRNFFETSGTPEGNDDYDYAGLEQKLKTWLDHTRTIRADINVKTIRVEDDVARAPYFYELNYQITGQGETPLWKREADTNEITLHRENGVWKITSGI